jgi:RimJ/RimL family protein N-acetyltransferase
MTTIRETPRLLLRPFLAEDAAGMFEMDSNSEVLKYIGTSPQTQLSESEAAIRYIQQQYHDNGVGRFAVILKETNTFIGWAGLKYLTETMNGHVNFYDVGYRFLSQYWGQGFATEAAKASLDFGFQQLHLDVIYAVAMTDNGASNRILTKIGMRHVNNFDLKGFNTAWFELKKGDFSFCYAK